MWSVPSDVGVGDLDTGCFEVIQPPAHSHRPGASRRPTLLAVDVDASI